MKHLLFSCRRKSCLNGKKGSMEILGRVFSVSGCGYRNSPALQLRWLISAENRSHLVPHARKQEFSAVWRKEWVPPPLTTQTMLAALRGVSLACKNIPIFKLVKSWWDELRSPNIRAVFPGWFWFLNQKSPAVLWLAIFYTFLTDREKKLKFQFQSFNMRPILSQLFSSLCTKLGVVLAAEAPSHGLAPLPALHTLCSLSQNTDPTWKCFWLKPHGSTRTNGPCFRSQSVIL